MKFYEYPFYEKKKKIEEVTNSKNEKRSSR